MSHANKTNDLVGSNGLSVLYEEFSNMILDNYDLHCQ